MLKTFEEAALEAGRAIIKLFREGCQVTLKADESPVTVADEEAERIILARLARDYPDIPVIAEEAVAAGKVPDKLIDAISLVGPAEMIRDRLQAWQHVAKQGHVGTMVLKGANAEVMRVVAEAAL